LLLSRFPYPSLRPGQDRLIILSNETIKNQLHTVIEAPTGIGKTIGILSGVLDDIIEKQLTLLYVCRTHTQMSRVIEELRGIVAKRNIPIRGLSLGGRHVMCIKANVRKLDSTTLNDTCNAIKKQCAFFKRAQSFDIKPLIQQIESKPMTHLDLYNFAKVRGLCPFELQKKVIPDLDVIALSYQYMFNPILRYHIIERKINLQNCFIVIDEAHNLPAIVKSILGNIMPLSTIRRAINETREFPQLSSLSEPKLISELLNEIYVKTIDHAHSKNLKVNQDIKITNRKDQKTKSLRGHISLCTDLNNQDAIDVFIDSIILWGEAIRSTRIQKEGIARSSLYRTGVFLKRMELAVSDPKLEVLLRKQKTRFKGGDYLLEIMVFDPRVATQLIFDRVYGSISMSGTMQPLSAYAEVVGINTPRCETFNSPYQQANFLVYCTPLLHTKGGGRRMSYDMQNVYVDRIMELVANTDGNTGVFCPSYDILNMLRISLKEKIDEHGKFLFAERGDLPSYHNDRMIREFKEHSKLRGAVLLGVCGGRNSEGQDFPGKEMSSVCIVGVPFAQWNIRTKLEVKYFNNVFPGRGRLYAYTIPAIRRAAQAAGRVIRSLSDRGIIVFMDQRFLYQAYNRYLPAWLSNNMKKINIKRGVLGNRVKKFFKLQDS